MDKKVKYRIIINVYRVLISGLFYNYSIVILPLLFKLGLMMSPMRIKDNHLTHTSGIYYENIGPIKIVTNTWDLTIFLDTSVYNEQWNTIESRLDKIKLLCEQ